MPDHPPSRIRPALWAGGGAVAVVAAAAILLWSHYGSAVFYETVMAGLAFCF